MSLNSLYRLLLTFSLLIAMPPTHAADPAATAADAPSRKRKRPDQHHKQSPPETPGADASG